MDGSYLNDLGFMRQAEAFAPVLAPLLKPEALAYVRLGHAKPLKIL